jgi:hypothetical protein
MANECSGKQKNDQADQAKPVPNARQTKSRNISSGPSALYTTQGRKLRVALAIHLDKHVAIDIVQRLQDPALCLVTLFLVELRRRFVRFNRYADHKPFGCLALSERCGKNRNSGY